MNTQTTQLQKIEPKPSKPSALAVMANRLSVEPQKLLDTLKATVFKGANNEELMALTVVANEYHLNPFIKEIYAFPAKGGGIVPIVSVDGWNKMLLRQADFDGIEFEFAYQNEALFSCTATIFLKNRGRPVRITEFLDECKRNTDPWNNMPHRMLRNRTLCQASRVAFGFAGVYDKDEAEDIIDISPTPTAPPPKAIAAAKPEKEQKASKGEQLGDAIIAAGFTFGDFKEWCVVTSNIPEIDSLTGFEDLKKEDASRLLSSQALILRTLGEMREREQKGEVAA